VKRRAFIQLGAAGAVAGGLPAPARAQTVPEISVGVAQSQDVVASIYAQSAGLFTKAGLNVQLVTLTNGAAISAAVVGGSLQIGFSSLQGLISGHVHGVPFQLIAPGGVYAPEDPYAYIFVRKDAPYQSARDLNGKTLGSPALKDLDWVASTAWINKNGGDSKNSKFIELPNPALLPALLDGRIDAFSLGMPWVQQALDSGKVRVLAKSFEAISPHFMMTAWFSTSDFATKNKDAMQRFERAMRDAATYNNTHHDEMVPLLADFTKLDPALIARTMKGSDAQYLDAKDIQPMIDVSAKFGMIAKSFKAEDMMSPVLLKPPTSH
jgi:NitT/TauT family transport system substrate-binding protein